MIESRIGIRWTCNSRVDCVDQEMLDLMARAGCWLIAWGIESGSEEILKRAGKGVRPEKALEALAGARKAWIRNWGYFIIGLPGETEATIRQTISLDIALFHVAAPHPGTPFFFHVVREGWFQAGTRWERVDMDKETVLNYPNLSAAQLQYWQRRAFREWALRPRPLLTLLRILTSDVSTLRSAVNTAAQHVAWAWPLSHSRREKPS
jgi:radical SAM superfamily enzyme YgiQ (UPF0313 family)